MPIKKLVTTLLLATGSIFLGSTARAEVVTINWTGSIDYVADIPSNDPRSLATLGISANWPPGTGGTSFTVSFSYDPATQPLSSTTDGVNSEAYFQGISASFSAGGKLLLQNAAPIIRITEDSSFWSFMPLVQIYPTPPLFLNDNLNNQTNWKLDLIKFGISNSDHATNAYNGISLLYNQLPTASQFQQIANEVDRSYTMWDPV